jgi:hypothetical protein
MEAFRDRTIKIDIPYNRSLRGEVHIYTKDFNRRNVRGKHIAPHTVRGRRDVGPAHPPRGAEEGQLTSCRR